MNNYVVYKHTSPSGKVYIGITCKNPDVRWASGFGYKQNKNFFYDIVKYGWDNFNHEILFSKLSKQEAVAKETDLIKAYKSSDLEYGYNQSENCDYHRPESVKKRIAENMPKRAVNQYSINCEFIAQFISLHEAARQTGIRADHISRNCRGLSRSAGGFLWAYSDDMENQSA